MNYIYLNGLQLHHTITMHDFRGSCQNIMLSLFKTDIDNFDNSGVITYFEFLFLEGFMMLYRPNTTSKIPGKNKSVSRIKQLDFGLQN